MGIGESGDERLLFLRKRKLLSLYMILTFFRTSKTIKHLSLDLGMKRSTVEWYKSELLSNGWIRKIDRVKGLGNAYQDRYAITRKGAHQLELLRNALLTPRNRSAKNTEEAIVTPWEKLEVIMDSGSTLAMACGEIGMDANIVRRKWRSYVSSGRRLDVLKKLWTSGQLKTDPHAAMKRRPNQRYPPLDWEDIEVKLVNGSKLTDIASQLGIPYVVLKGRWDRYRRSGKRQSVTRELLLAGAIGEAADQLPYKKN
ncbi:MAG: hypothetical protein M1148_03445 [Candidatus Thermoplasmatota archaeon]|nr:hypothetical protein [Candidatus Thermoplasmatota archaeon]MCL5438233.1 hypothetical protein [Candidatus Thermoplasmatota archaeon]